MASPLVDSKELGFLDANRLSVHENTIGEYETVKIGHTSLHNPGGRSSWIGL